MLGVQGVGKTVLLWFLAALVVFWAPGAAKAAFAQKDIVATAGKGIVITGPELERAMGRYRAATGKKKLSGAEVSGILENLIRRKLLLQVPAVKRYRADPAIVAKVRDYEDTQIVARWVEDKIDSKVQVSEEEIRAYYEKNRQQFRTPPGVKASYILLRTRGEAERVLKKLHKGVAFALLAKQYSIDLPTGRRGGLIGTISESRNPSALGKVLFLLAPKETSGIITTKAGYAIFKADAIYPPGFKPYDVVHNTIREGLIRKKAHDAFKKIVQNLEKKGGIKIFKARLAAIARTSGSAPGPAAQQRAAATRPAGKCYDLQKEATKRASR